jgi:hypothetical protein
MSTNIVPDLTPSIWWITDMPLKEILVKGGAGKLSRSPNSEPTSVSSVLVVMKQLVVVLPLSQHLLLFQPRILNDNKMAILEESTQNNKALWAQARLHRITASKIHRVFKNRKEGAL